MFRICWLTVLVAAVAAAAPPSRAPAEKTSVGSVRAAVADLSATFGPRYPRGAEFLRRLAQIERAGGDLAALQREALVANPLVCAQPILFVVRPQYWGHHGSINTMFQVGEIQSGTFRGGGAMKTVRFGPDGRAAEVRTLLEVPQGIARDPEVSFDGRRIVFAMRKTKADDYHIYEMTLSPRLGPGDVRQLTFGSKLADVEPMVLPDGRIAFNSTRDLKFCQCNRHPMGNLFAMDADGANLIQIGGNDLWEGHPSLLSDGTILYSRWEYVDRQFGPSFGLWTCNPDGTNHVLYYGNNAWAPGTILDARAIPGSSRVVCIFGACHDLPWGAMAIVDRHYGMDGSKPVVRIWPASTRKWLANQNNLAWTPNHIDLFQRTRPKYEDPYPLADAATGRGAGPSTGLGAGKYFLVARTLTEDTSRKMQTGIFLVDVFGNELLLHTEKPGCYDPMPLGPRPRPAARSARTDLARREGVFYVYDVCSGTGMERVPRGTIRYLRVIEAPPKRAWTRPGGGGIDGDQAPAVNWNLTNNKRILGDVPVEPDGSAHFIVPANTFVYFQALDADKMMVQSMRSGTLIQPGETTGCVGCHERRHSAVPNAPRAAWRRAPSRPEPWLGPPREFNYLTEVQPVFDKHCVRCHGYGKKGAQKLLLAGDLGVLFNASYLDLNRRSAVRWSPDKPGAKKLLVKAVHDGPPAVLAPYAWGAHRSRIVDVLRAGHNKVKLTSRELQRIVTWIDLNVPYYGSYTSVYPDHPFGRSPLDARQLARLAQLAGKRTGDLKHDPTLQVSFTRPQRSPILARFKGPGAPKYTEALALLRAGKAELTRRPREDMLGPRARPTVRPDVERHEHWLARCRREALARKAILTGTKYYPRRAPEPEQP